ncbi:MAG TPA: hypothetical protein VL122_10200 [Nitrospirota bacterium]|nr:hypothetical protein [Nitrospirota bacterium]
MPGTASCSQGAVKLRTSSLGIRFDDTLAAAALNRIDERVL